MRDSNNLINFADNYQTIDKLNQHEINELKAENIKLQRVIAELRKQLITLLKEKTF